MVTYYYYQAELAFTGAHKTMLSAKTKKMCLDKQDINCSSVHLIGQLITADAKQQ